MAMEKPSGLALSQSGGVPDGSLLVWALLLCHPAPEPCSPRMEFAGSTKAGQGCQCWGGCPAGSTSVLPGTLGAALLSELPHGLMNPWHCVLAPVCPQRQNLEGLLGSDNLLAAI